MIYVSPNRMCLNESVCKMWDKGKASHCHENLLKCFTEETMSKFTFHELH